MIELEPQGGPKDKPAILALYGEEAEAWRKHYRRYFKYAARALGLGVVAGFIYFMLRPDQERKALEFVVRALKDLPLEGSPVALSLDLFYHNARASATAVAAGLVPFLFLNGGVLGLLISVSKHQGLDVPRLVLTQILPHGVFELAAVLYATSVGLYLSENVGKRVLAAWRRKRSQRRGQPPPALDLTDFLQTYPERSEAGSESLAGNVFRSFFLVVLPLLLVAAAIEGFITPHLR
jgi:uncharacterized membrane protein SpoIIM required for sporulation